MKIAPISTCRNAVRLNRNDRLAMIIMGRNDTNVTRNRQKVKTSGVADPAMIFPEVQLPPQATIDNRIRRIKILLLGVRISVMEIVCATQLVGSRSDPLRLSTERREEPIYIGRG